MRFFLVVLLFVLAALVAVDAAVLSRHTRAVNDNYGYNGWGYNNLVTDSFYGGPTSLGWAQVPHVMSPMFSPVFGR